jgi:hypothetical protein
MRLFIIEVKGINHVVYGLIRRVSVTTSIITSVSGGAIGGAIGGVGGVGSIGSIDGCWSYVRG